MPYEYQRRKLSSCLLSFTALTIRCYECAPNFTNLSSSNICSNRSDTIECTDPSHDSCLSISMTGLRGNVSGIAEFTFHSVNCTMKLLCDEIKNFACDLLKNEANAPGVKLENCEISCCQGDLCNKPLGGPSASSSPRTITPDDAAPNLVPRVSHLTA